MLLIIKVSLITLLCLFSLRLITHNSANLKQKVILATLCLCILLPLFSYIPFSININKWGNLYSSTPTSINDNAPVLQTNIINIANNSKNTETIVNPSETNQTITFLQLFLTLWIIGIVLRLTQYIFQFICIKNLVLQSKPFELVKCNIQPINKINCLISSKTQVPFLFVTFKTVHIVLPEKASNWDSKTLNNIISHELCHYSRKDHIALWLIDFVSIVYWFHPFILLLRNKHKNYMELACDHALLCNGMDPQSYAQTLLSISQNKKELPIVAHMSSNKSFLKKRILAIINLKSPKLNLNQLLLLMFIAFQITLVGCVNSSILMTESSFYKLLSYQLPSFRKGTITPGTIQISTVYDGKQGNTFLELEFYNKEYNQTSWLKLGPLKKFNDQIQTWQYKTLNQSELTGRYKISGVVADGAVDGVALGIIYANQKGEMVIHKSKGPMSNGYPNIVCSWPLDFRDSQIKQWAPQQKTLNAETVKRLICGAQLLDDGEYSIN